MKTVNLSSITVNYAVGWENDNGQFNAVAGFLYKHDAEKYLETAIAFHSGPLTMREVIL